MTKFLRKVRCYLRRKGIIGLLKKAVAFFYERVWSNAEWLVYEHPLNPDSGESLELVQHRVLDFDDLFREQYFKAIEFPSAIRERFANGAVCHGFFVQNDLVTVGWSTAGHLELDVGISLQKPGAVGLYDFFTYTQFRGKGYYSRALEYLLYEMSCAGYTQAFIAVDPGNLPSRKAIDRAGFVLRSRVSRHRRFGCNLMREVKSAD